MKKLYLIPKLAKLAKPAKLAKKRKRLVRGTDFDVWAFKYHDGHFSTMTYEFRPTILDGERSEGRWVRVRFVEVKP